MSILTDKNLELAQDVLHALAKYTEENEPYAINTIELFNEAASQIPSESDLQV